MHIVIQIEETATEYETISNHIISAMPSNRVSAEQIFEYLKCLLLIPKHKFVLTLCFLVFFRPFLKKLSVGAPGNVNYLLEWDPFFVLLWPSGQGDGL